jgi:cysteine desulfurase/selenocysteine lyase
VTRRELSRMVASLAMASMPWSRSGGSETAATGDLEYLSADFPALLQSVGEHALVYLDSAATTQRPLSVIQSMVDYYHRVNANPGPALHALARRAHESYEDARQTIARFLNAASADEIVWVRGTTEAINLVATAWGRSALRPGDEILLTVSEHASNLLPWRLATEHTGAKLRFVDVDDEGRILLADLDRQLSDRTRLVAFSHVSNVAGYINDAREICTRAHRAGAKVLVDAAQSVPHVGADVQGIGCDFLAFSSHKMLGPMGVGVLWSRREILEAMPPYQAGSNMAHDIDRETQQLEHGARKFGAGTPNVTGPVGLAAAVRYLEAIGRNAIEWHEERLTRYALERFAEVSGLRLLGPKEATRRIPVFSFVLSGWAPLEVMRRLDEQGIAVRAGDLSALPLLRRFGVNAAARASLYLYSRPSDVDRLVEALQRMSRELRRPG